MRKTCPAQKGHPYVRQSWPLALAHALIWLGILKSLQFVRCSLSTPPPPPCTVGSRSQEVKFCILFHSIRIKALHFNYSDKSLLILYFCPVLVTARQGSCYKGKKLWYKLRFPSFPRLGVCGAPQFMLLRGHFTIKSVTENLLRLNNSFLHVKVNNCPEIWIGLIRPWFHGIVADQSCRRPEKQRTAKQSAFRWRRSLTRAKRAIFTLGRLRWEKINRTLRDWSKRIGSGGGGGGLDRSIWKCGWEKTHGPLPPFSTKMTDPPLKQGCKLHDPPSSCQRAASRLRKAARRQPNSAVRDCSRGRKNQESM